MKNMRHGCSKRRISGQGWWWAGGILGAVLLIGACGGRERSRPGGGETEGSVTEEDAGSLSDGGVEQDAARHLDGSDGTWLVDLTLPEDVGPDGSGDPDEGLRDGGHSPDLGEPDLGPPPPPEHRLILQGLLLTEEGPLEGELLILEDGRIGCVGASCTAEPGAAGVPVLATRGIISPGLIDGHNHLAYNFLRPWRPDPPQLFRNRYQWADEPDYEAYITPYSVCRSENRCFCPAAKWGELRCLVHGTTMVLGHSFNRRCLDGWVRNADHYHQLGPDLVRTNIGSVRDITDAEALEIERDLNADVGARYCVHLQEGIDGDHVGEEFDSFDGLDPRPNRHRGLSLVLPGAVLIHSMGLTPGQIERVLESDAKVVLSVSSNIELYGETAPVRAFLEQGVQLGISPDWTVSGTANMLAELSYLRSWRELAGVPELDDHTLWRLSTAGNAAVLGFEQRVGRLVPGFRADVTVFAGPWEEPYRTVGESRAEDVLLVFVDGRPLYGDLAWREAAQADPLCEPFDACGTPKFLCVRGDANPQAANDQGQALADIEAELLVMLGPDRADDLLPLVECAGPGPAEDAGVADGGETDGGETDGGANAGGAMDGGMAD